MVFLKAQFLTHCYLFSKCFLLKNIIEQHGLQDCCRGDVQIYIHTDPSHRLPAPALVDNLTDLKSPHSPLILILKHYKDRFLSLYDHWTLRSFCWVISLSAAGTLVHGFVTSRLTEINSVLYGDECKYYF